MATLALAFAGAGIGSFFGVPALGFALGNVAGQLLFGRGGEQPDGPRLEDLSVGSSALGAPVPRGWGTWQFAGNVIWSLRLLEVENEEDIGKGGSNTITTYSYFGTASVAFCAGPLDGSGAQIRRIWMDAKLVADYSEGAGPELQPDWITLYDGSETQMPSALQEADKGAGNVPGYRGVVIAEFENVPVDEYGARFPSVRAEVVFPVVLAGHLVEPPWPARPPIGQQVWYYSTDTMIAFGDGTGSGPGTGFDLPRTLWTLNGMLVDNTPATYTAPRGTSGNQIYGPVRQTGIDVTEVAVGTARNVANDTPVCWWQDRVALPDVGPPGGGWLKDDTSTVLTFSVWGKGVWDPLREMIYLHVGNFGASPPPEFHVFDCSTIGGAIVLSTQARTRYTPPAGFFVQDVHPLAGSVYALLYSAGEQRVVSLDVIETPPVLLATWTVVLQTGGYCGLLVDDRFSPIRAIVCEGNTSQYRVYELPDGGGAGVELESGFAQDDTTATGEPARVEPNLMMQKQQLVTTGAVGAGPAKLSDVIRDTCILNGIAPADVDTTGVTDEVSGVALTRQSTGRQFLEPLLAAWQVDPVETDHKYFFRSRNTGAVVATIPDDDLGARTVGSPGLPGEIGDTIETRRRQSDELPRTVTVRYRNFDREHESGAQRFRVLADGVSSDEVLEVAATMTDDEAAAVAERAAMARWTERDTATLRLGPKWLALDPADAIMAASRRYRIVETNADYDAGIFEHTLVVDRPKELTTSTPGTSDPDPPDPKPPVAGDTLLTLLDIPLLRDEDIPVEVGFYFGASGVTAGWPGATLLRSRDSGTTWQQVGARSTNTVRGTAQTVLADGPAGFDWNQVDWTGDANQPWDTANTVDVLVGSIGTLGNASRAEILAGLNTGVLGSELIGWESAADQGSGIWRLSGLLRGRRGSEAARTAHATSERFAVLGIGPTGRVSTGTDELTVIRKFRAPTFGADITTATPEDFADSGISLRPFSVVELLRKRPPVGTGWTVTISWLRRSRYGEEYRNFDTDPPPLDAATALYEVEIWDPAFAVLKRVAPVSVLNSFDYTEAMQNADFGDAGPEFGCRVYQLHEIYPAMRGTVQQIVSAGFTDGGPKDPTIEPTPNVGADFIASEALVEGDFVNIHDDNGARVRKASRSVPLRAHGYVLESVAAGVYVTVYESGIDTFGPKTAGVEAWLGESGLATPVRPTVAGHIEQRLGVGTSTGTWIEIGAATVKSA